MRKVLVQHLVALSTYPHLHWITTISHVFAAVKTESTIQEQESIHRVQLKETKPDFHVKNDLQEDEAKEEASENIHQDKPCELESSLGAWHEVKPCTDAHESQEVAEARAPESYHHEDQENIVGQ